MNNDALKGLDAEAVRKNLEQGEAFALKVAMNDAQPALEACGLILNPKDGTYQSLEEGDRWKVEEKDGGILVSPSPILYDVSAGAAMSGMPLEDMLGEDEAKLMGTFDDSPEGKAMDGPKQ